MTESQINTVYKLWVLVIKNLLTKKKKKSPRPEFCQTFRKEYIPLLLRLFQENWRAHVLGLRSHSMRPTRIQCPEDTPRKLQTNILLEHAESSSIKGLYTMTRGDLFLERKEINQYNYITLTKWKKKTTTLSNWCIKSTWQNSTHLYDKNN